MLAESGAGTLAGEAHAEGLFQLARSDAGRLSEAYQRGIDSSLLAADFKLPDDGLYQIASEGEFVHLPTGFRQQLDADACRAVVNDFTQRAAQPGFPGLLVDPARSPPRGREGAVGCARRLRGSVRFAGPFRLWYAAIVSARSSGVRKQEDPE